MRNVVLTENEDVVKREIDNIKAVSARITANLDAIGKVSPPKRDALCSRLSSTPARLIRSARRNSS
ncbi:MAG: hypothetical protein ABWY05_12720 [Noviherbaspirillum sp.]